MKMITEEEIRHYQEVKENLDTFKAEEAKLRKILAQKIKNSKDTITDTKKGRYDLHESGYSLKVTVPTNVKVDNDSLDMVYSELTEEEQKCFHIKYDLVNENYKEFKEMHEDGELEFDPDIFDYLTESDGMPKLEIKGE